MTTDAQLKWQRGQCSVEWCGEDIRTPGMLLCASELPHSEGFAIVTLFDELTPCDQTNGYVFHPNTGYTEIRVMENQKLIRLLGCYCEHDYLVFRATNETEYLMNPITLQIIKSRYYR